MGTRSTPGSPPPSSARGASPGSRCSPEPSRPRTGPILGTLITISPPVARCFLPWEDPFASDRSPLAAVISVFILDLFALPQCVAGLVMLTVRLVGRDQHA